MTPHPFARSVINDILVFPINLPKIPHQLTDIATYSRKMGGPGVDPDPHGPNRGDVLYCGACMLKELLKPPLFQGMTLLGRTLRPLEASPSKDRIGKILVFQLGGIGDVLNVFPAIQALAEGFPRAELHTLTEFGDELFGLFPYSEQIARKHRYAPRGRHRPLAKKIAFFLSLRKEKFDLILNTNRGNIITETSIMAFMIGAPYRLGFDKDGRGVLNNVRLEFRYDEPILAQNLNLLRRKLGLDVRQTAVRLRIPDSDRVFSQSFLQREEDILVVAVHPGAKYFREFKMWPLENYCELIRQISLLYKAKFVLVGDAGEADAAETIRSRIESADIVNTAGKTTISQMAALIKDSDFFIGNDSGPLHIAIALNVSSIGIFGFTSPGQLLPLDLARVIALSPAGRPLYTHQPSLKVGRRPEHAPHVSVQEVFTAFAGLAARLRPNP